MKNRVWIELERPSSDEEGERRAELACRMLRRLGVERGTPVFWHTKGCYCFTIDEAGSYAEAADNGHWYNLDYFGRE